MFIYNIHTPSKTFALGYRPEESFDNLVARILAKADLSDDEKSAVKLKKEGAGLVYEFEGGRWSLEDDGDLQILQTRLPPATSTSATLHLTLPHAHAHFAKPPTYTTPSSAIKSKTQRSTKARSASDANGSSADSKSSGQGVKDKFGIGPDAAAGHAGNALGPAASSGIKKPNGSSTITDTSGKAKSTMSSKSRRSKWGDDDAEPMGEVIKREWTDFHNNIGTRTVLGKVGKTENVRMLLKTGYRHVYVSRTFAIKSGLVPKKYSMGTAGYAGLKTLGSIPITVGSKTMSHPAYISEETHFDVVLGRSWIEKMGVKTDPLDQTTLTYMDSGEAIPCDLVVLKDADGNVITIT